jgi:hypothetical protein
MGNYQTSMRLVFLLTLLAILQGCAGKQSFGLAARAGDTVALVTGWNQAINSSNLTIQFTDANSNVVTYQPGDPGIRAVVQLYPDPASNLIAQYSTGQTNESGFYSGTFVGSFIDAGYTNHDADWNQTVVYVDLPATLASGLTTISLLGPSGSLTNSPSATLTDGSVAPILPIKVTILPGTGASNPLNSQGGGNGSSLSLMERSNYYTVTFTGSTIPDSIQLDLTRTAGTGLPWVVNPRGDLKNVAWRDDGSTSLRVILTTSHGVPLADMKHFKFYVTSGIPLTGLAVANVAAYDTSGYPISGITANVSFTQ